MLPDDSSSDTQKHCSGEDHKPKHHHLGYPVAISDVIRFEQSDVRVGETEEHK